MWRTTACTRCTCFEVTISQPVRVIISDHSDDPDHAICFWFEEHNQHVLVLFFAWNYILSARWAEIFKGTTGPQYKKSTEPATNNAHGSEDMKKIDVELFDVSDDAYRWWCAVLSAGWSAQRGSHPERITPRGQPGSTAGTHSRCTVSLRRIHQITHGLVHPQRRRSVRRWTMFSPIASITTVPGRAWLP